MWVHVDPCVGENSPCVECALVSEDLLGINYLYGPFNIFFKIKILGMGICLYCYQKYTGYASTALYWPLFVQPFSIGHFDF